MDLAFITKAKAKNFSFLVKAKAKDFYVVLKDTPRPRPRTNIPESHSEWLQLLWCNRMYKLEQARSQRQPTVRVGAARFQGGF